MFLNLYNITTQSLCIYISEQTQYSTPNHTKKCTFPYLKYNILKKITTLGQMVRHISHSVALPKAHSLLIFLTNRKVIFLDTLIHITRIWSDICAKSGLKLLQFFLLKAWAIFQTMFAFTASVPNNSRNRNITSLLLIVRKYFCPISGISFL